MKASWRWKSGNKRKSFWAFFSVCKQKGEINMNDMKRGLVWVKYGNVYDFIINIDAWQIFEITF